MTPHDQRLRAMLAGQALAGLCVNEEHNSDPIVSNEQNSKYAQIAQRAVAYADAVLDRLKQTDGAGRRPITLHAFDDLGATTALLMKKGGAL